MPGYQSEEAWLGWNTGLYDLLGYDNFGTSASSVRGIPGAGSGTSPALGEFGDILGAARTKQAELIARQAEQEAKQNALAKAETLRKQQAKQESDAWRSQHDRTSRLASLAAQTLKTAGVAYDIRIFGGSPRQAKNQLDRVKPGERAVRAGSFWGFTYSVEDARRERYETELGRGIEASGWLMGIVERHHYLGKKWFGSGDDHQSHEAKRTKYTYGILADSGKLKLMRPGFFVEDASIDDDPSLQPDRENSSDGLAIEGGCVARQLGRTVSRPRFARPSQNKR